MPNIVLAEGHQGLLLVGGFPSYTRESQRTCKYEADSKIVEQITCCRDKNLFGAVVEVQQRVFYFEIEPTRYVKH